MDLTQFAAESTLLHQRLVRVTYALSGDYELAQECAQEALVRAWRQLQIGASIDSMEAWCVTAALNWCRSELRRSGSSQRTTERLALLNHSEPSAVDEPTTAFDGDVRTAVLALPLRQREVVVLHYLLDLDIRDIAERCGISAGAVKNALHHARRTLRRTLTTTTSPAETSP